MRARLERAAERRRHQLDESQELADEIRALVRDAHETGVPMAEVARLLGIDRSTLYRVYAA